MNKSTADNFNGLRQLADNINNTVLKNVNLKMTIACARHGRNKVMYSVILNWTVKESGIQMVRQKEEFIGKAKEVNGYLLGYLNGMNTGYRLKTPSIGGRLA